MLFCKDDNNDNANNDNTDIRDNDKDNDKNITFKLDPHVKQKSRKFRKTAIKVSLELLVSLVLLQMMVVIPSENLKVFC